jgi:hypothetical protein
LGIYLWKNTHLRLRCFRARFLAYPRKLRLFPPLCLGFRTKWPGMLWRFGTAGIGAVTAAAAGGMAAIGAIAAGVPADGGTGITTTITATTIGSRHQAIGTAPTRGRSFLKLAGANH